MNCHRLYLLYRLAATIVAAALPFVANAFVPALLDAATVCPLAATPPPTGDALGTPAFCNAYDLAGNLTNRLDAAGNAVSCGYDALNRLVSRSAPSMETFSYDAVGNLLSASNETATLSFSYDAMDRVAAASVQISSLQTQTTYTHDLGGLITNMVYAPGKSVSREHDHRSILTFPSKNSSLLSTADLIE